MVHNSVITHDRRKSRKEQCTEIMYMSMKMKFSTPEKGAREK